ncbi:TPA: hypothetical protein ACH3X3_005716 [Trebouxia sp. C0006]
MASLTAGSASSLTSSEDASKSGASLVLQHPNGGQVYLVGVAHVSGQAAQEVKDVIQTVSPRVVVLELDQDRFDKLQQRASDGDEYGLKKHLQYGFLQPIVVALSGNALEYMLSLAYVVGGALLGTPAGGEFLAAKHAATQVGAEIMLGDRDQRMTMQRMAAMAAQYRRGTPGQPTDQAQLIPRHTPSQEGALQTSGSRSDRSSMESASDLANSTSDMIAGADQGSNNPSEAWGNSDADKQNAAGNIVQDLMKQPEAAMDPHRWHKILEKGGCDNGQAVVDAFGRMLKQGSTKGACIDTQDLLTVRNCGVKMLENFRQQALQAGDDGMKQVEDEAMMGVKGVTGTDPNRDAMHEVMGHERDLILARRIWEAGNKAEGQGVVGVVGAAHVKGIQARWDDAGSPETAKKVAEYCGTDALALPTQAGPWINMAAGAGIVYLGWRRPRFAKITGAVAAIVLGPYLVFTTPVISRYQKFAENIVTAAEKLNREGGIVFGDSSWGDDSKP